MWCFFWFYWVIYDESFSNRSVSEDPDQSSLTLSSTIRSSDRQTMSNVVERACCRDYQRLGLGTLSNSLTRSKNEPFRISTVNRMYTVCRRWIPHSRDVAHWESSMDVTKSNVVFCVMALLVTPGYWSCLRASQTPTSSASLAATGKTASPWCAGEILAPKRCFCARPACMPKAWWGSSNRPIRTLQVKPETSYTPSMVSFLRFTLSCEVKRSTGWRCLCMCVSGPSQADSTSLEQEKYLQAIISSMPSYSESSGRNTLSGFTSSHMSTSGQTQTLILSLMLTPNPQLTVRVTQWPTNYLDAQKELHAFHLH